MKVYDLERDKKLILSMIEGIQKDLKNRRELFKGDTRKVKDTDIILFLHELDSRMEGVKDLLRVLK